MARKRGCKWYQSVGLQILNISADFKIFLKDPGPLNSKKRFGAAKQLYEERHTIKERPGLKTESWCAPCTKHAYPGALQSAVLFTAA